MLQKWTTATTVMLFLLLYLTAQEWMKWHCFKVKNFKIQQQQQRNQLRENQIPKNTPKKFFVFFLLKNVTSCLPKNVLCVFFRSYKSQKRTQMKWRKIVLRQNENIFFLLFFIIIMFREELPCLSSKRVSQPQSGLKHKMWIWQKWKFHGCIHKNICEYIYISR